MSREYDTDGYLYKIGMRVMAAVLLLLVAATGYFLMKDDGQSSDLSALALALLAAFTLGCMVMAKTAHGSQQQPARTTTDRVTSSTPPSTA